MAACTACTEGMGAADPRRTKQMNAKSTQTTVYVQYFTEATCIIELVKVNAF